MRRSLSLLLLASIFPLGCGENQVAKETNQARAEFAKVVGMVQEVKQGFLHSEKGLAAMGDYKPAMVKFDDAAMKEAMKEGHLRGYQAALIAQAEGQLKGLVNRGQTSQKVAAHQLLASLHLASAAFDQRAAMKLSDALADPSASIETFLLSIERTGALAGRFSNDDKPVVEKWTQNQEVVAATVTKLKSEDAELTKEIEGLTKQIADETAKREDAFKRASALRAEAFPKKGKEQYDLHIQSIEAEREGQAANTKVDEYTVALNLAKAKQSLLQRELGITQKWEQTLAAGLGDAEKRKSTLEAFEKTVTDERNATVTRLTEDFGRFSEGYNVSVSTKLDGAISKVTEAIDTLKKADAMATGEAKVAVKFDLLDALIAKLNTQADSIVASSRFGTIAEQVRSRAAAVMPQAAAPLTEATTAVRAKLDDLVAKSLSTVSEINALTADAALSGIREGDALGDARISRIKSAKALASAHAARLPLHDLDAKAPAPEAPAAPVAPPADAETPAAPAVPAPAAPAPAAPAAPDAPAAPAPADDEAK